jgi:hypothetical protein
MRRAVLVAFMLIGATTVRAQMTGAIDKARKAAAVEDKHISAETGQQTKQDAKKQDTKSQTKTAPPAKTGGKPTPATVPQGTGTGGKVGPKSAKPNPQNDSVPSFVMRESFDYGREGRRDPFISLLTTSDLRPTIADLKLLGIVFDETGRRSVAIMRDQANKQYLATVGETLGRMRVTQIKPRAVIFTIEEFGFSRQDSLVLSDTVKVRP